MNFNEQFDDGFSPLEAGDYNVTVSKLEYKTSKSGSEYLSIGFRTENNRIIFEIFNLFHKDDKVRNIAMSSMKKLLTACEISPERLTSVTKESLLGLLAEKRVTVSLVVQKDEQYGDKNKVKGYKKCQQTEMFPF